VLTDVGKANASDGRDSFSGPLTKSPRPYSRFVAIRPGATHEAALIRLRRLAAQRLAQEKPGQTLDATALVHEAYLRFPFRLS
jgi:hypothetical protein